MADQFLICEFYKIRSDYLPRLQTQDVNYLNGRSALMEEFKEFIPDMKERK